MENRRSRRIDHLEACNEIAYLYLKEGRYDEAIQVYRGLEFAFEYQCQMAIKIFEEGEYKKALKYCIKIQKRMKNITGFNDPDIFKIMTLVADIYGEMNKFKKALRLHLTVYAKKFHGYASGHLETVSGLRGIVLMLYKCGKYDEALNTFQKIYVKMNEALGPEHEDTLISHKDIAMLFTVQGKYDKALKIYKKTYGIQRRIRPEHPETLATINRIAEVLQLKGKYEEALTLFSEVYEIRKRQSPLHRDTVISLIYIANVYRDQGKYSEAACRYFEIHEMYESPEHPVALDTEYNIAALCMKQGKFHEASAILESLHAICLKRLGPEHSKTLSVRTCMAAVLSAERNNDGALEIYNEILEIKKNTDLGPNHLETLRTECDIAGVYVRLGRYEEALEMYERVLEERLAVSDIEHPECVKIQIYISGLYSKKGKHNEAFQMVYEIYEKISKSFSIDHENCKEAKLSLETLARRVTTPKLIMKTIEEDLTAVQSCIQEGDNVNVRHTDGSVPLHIASGKGSTEIIEVLLKNGAFYDIQDKDGKTPVDLARDDATKDLLNEVHTLFRCVRENRLHRINQIITVRKSIINSKDKGGCTPLHWATSKGCVEIVKLLLNEGADITSVTKRGNTVLHCSTSLGDTEIVDTFLKHMQQHNADKMEKCINGKTKAKGRTALHIASKYGHLNIVKLLKDYGANPRIKDKLGKLPSDLAI